MGTSASDVFDLRNFYFYQSGNTFIGSLKGFNYKISPESDKLKIMIWHGMLCSDLAEMELENEFPCTQEGFDEMIKWLEDTYRSEGGQS